jgi:ATP-binding cassette subfamily F protein uup
MIAYTAELLSKSYGEKKLFDQITFTLADTQKIGLIGLNGTGKTSLLRIIAGVDTPDSGLSYSAKGITIHYLPQSPDFPEDSTVLSYIFQSEHPAIQLIKRYEDLLENYDSNGTLSAEEEKQLLQMTEQMDQLNAWDLEHQAKTILTKLGIKDFHQTLGSLSGGTKKRIALARALITPCDLLLLDEPTNHMDNDSIEWLEKYLQTRKGALIMITHDRYFLDRVVNEIFELDRSKLFVYPGSYSHYLEGKDERLQLENAQNYKLKRLYSKELEWIRAGVQARATKQKARIQRFESIRENLPAGDSADVEISTAYTRLGKQVIEAEHLNFSYGDKLLLKDFTLILQKADRIGIVGDNGTGKTTFLNLLMKSIEPTSGIVRMGETVNLAYFSQETPELKSDERMIDYVRATAEYLETEDGSRLSAAQMLERFLFPVHSHRTPINRLSGGEGRRLHLLKTLALAPNVLFMDEPTNDLDIDTLNVLESYLDNFNGAVIIVSHDRYFLDRTCTRLLSFEGNGSIRILEGSYTENQNNLTRETTSPVIDQRLRLEQELKRKSEKKTDKIRLSYAQKKALESLPEEIEALDHQLSKVLIEMENNPADFVLLQRLEIIKSELEENLLQKMEQLEALDILALQS